MKRLRLVLQGRSFRQGFQMIIRDPDVLPPLINRFGRSEGLGGVAHG